MADEEEIQEEVSQEEEIQMGQVAEEQTAEGEESQVTEEEAADDTTADYEEPKKGFVSRYWMLGLGFLLAVMGVVAIVGLRTNFIQVYLLGYSDPSPGIGSQEYMGYGAAGIPYAIGIIMVVIWGQKTPPLPEAGEGEVVEEPEPEAAVDEPEALAEPEEFGHEHLPPHHLTTVEKIEHLTKVYAQGKMSEGLYKENLERFEAVMERERAEAEEAANAGPQSKKSAYQELKSLKPEVAKNEEDHLPPHHLSPEEKIDHLTKSYAQGKVSRVFFDKNLKKFEAELKREKEYLPPAELHPRQKLEQLEDAFKMGVISKSTYDKNKKLFEIEMKNSPDDMPELDADLKAEVPESQNLEDDLDSLLKDVDEDEKQKGTRKKTLMEELEDLEDL